MVAPVTSRSGSRFDPKEANHAAADNRWRCRRVVDLGELVDNDILDALAASRYGAGPSVGRA